jgi:hypothetical protein
MSLLLGPRMPGYIYWPVRAWWESRPPNTPTFFFVQWHGWMLTGTT